MVTRDTSTTQPARERERRGDIDLPPWRLLPGTDVRVWLFGSLSSLASERPLTLPVPDSARVEQVLVELGRLLGPQFTERVFASPDKKMCTCRIFLDGLPVELDDSLHSSHVTRDLELILLTAVEGG